MKPKTNRSGDEYTPKGYDNCQTPSYALEPIIPYLKKFDTIWEPACGEGYLVDALRKNGFSVDAGDIKFGHNFFNYVPLKFDAIVTNPPYSGLNKYKWLERCYDIGEPFALLLPVEVLGARKAQVLFDRYGVEIIFLSKRVNFKMPNAGWSGKGAQFPTAWFTDGLQIGKEMTFAEIDTKNFNNTITQQTLF